MAHWVTAAFVDAVTWCRVFQKPPPAWVDEAAHQVVTQRQTKAEAKRRYELAIHFVRWDAVTELRKRRRELSESRNDIEPDMSWERCYEVAAQHLARTAPPAARPRSRRATRWFRPTSKKGVVRNTTSPCCVGDDWGRPRGLYPILG